MLTGLLPEGSRECRVLWLAGSAALYALAGRLPIAATVPARAPADEQAEAPHQLLPLLADVLTGELAALAPWLVERLQRCGFRLPACLLPVTLSQANAATWLPVLGARGCWLAGQRAEWQPLLQSASRAALGAEELQRDWEEGGFDTRCRAVAEQRRRDPALARAWLEAALPQEKAERRQVLVEILAIGLAAEDETLLESLLDDRSQAVRQAAAGLLAHLPGSALARRLADRLAPCLHWSLADRPHGSLAKVASWFGKPAGPELLVEPPGDLGKDWERDGILANPPGGEGKRAFWLRQLLALVPPRHWAEPTGAAPAALLPKLRASEWSEALLGGIAAASRRFGDADWAGALLEPSVLASSALSPHAAGLWQVLTQETRARVASGLLASGYLDGAIIGLQQSPAPWSVELVQAVAAALRRSGPASIAANDVGFHRTLLELTVLRGVDDAMTLLLPLAALYAADTTAKTDWAANQRTKLAERATALIEAKLTFIKEMPS